MSGLIIGQDGDRSRDCCKHFAVWIENAPCRHMKDSQNMLRKISKGMLRKEWASQLTYSQVADLTWGWCPGYAGMHRNERADWLWKVSHAGCAETGQI